VAGSTPKIRGREILDIKKGGAVEIA